MLEKIEKTGNPVTAFRLPKPERAALEFVCAQHDLSENAYIRTALWAALVADLHAFAGEIGKRDARGRPIAPPVDDADHPARGCCSE